MLTLHTRRLLFIVIGKNGEISRQLRDELWSNNKYERVRQQATQCKIKLAEKVAVSIIELTRKCNQSKPLIVLFCDLVFSSVNRLRNCLYAEHAIGYRIN